MLLVEDDAAICRFVALALDGLPVELRTVGTVADAIAEVRRQPPELLFTDLMLPDGDGLLLLERAATDPGWLAGAPVVVFSARVSATSRRQALSLGAWRVLDKPVPLGVLRGCIEEACELSRGPADVAPAAGSSRDSDPA